MAAVLQTTFLNSFSCMNILIQISLTFVPKGPSNKNPAFVSINGLAPIERPAIIWTNNGLVYWRIYALFGLNE